MADKKKSLKPIPPTLRGKKRYIKFQLLTNQKLREMDVKDSVWRVFGRLFGEKGIAEQKLWVVKWLPQNNGVLRCSLEKEEEAKAGILFIKKIGETPVIPVILGVSGSLSKLK